MSSSLDYAALWLQLFSLILSVPWCVSVSIAPASCPCLYLSLSHFQFSVSTCRFVLSCPFSLSSLLSASGCPVASTFSLSICLDILPPHRFFSCLTPSLYFHPLCFSLSLSCWHFPCPFFSPPQSPDSRADRDTGSWQQCLMETY